jgi:hypothetical protein
VKICVPRLGLYRVKSWPTISQMQQPPKVLVLLVWRRRVCIAGVEKAG